MYTSFINSSGGPLTITLIINNAIRSGAKFGIWQLDAASNSWVQVAADLTAATGSTGRASIDLPSSPADLLKQSLTWRINVCASLDPLNSGVLQLEVLQNGARCLITSDRPGATNSNPIQWNVSDVPACSEGRVLPVVGEMRFRSNDDLNALIARL